MCQDKTRLFAADALLTTVSYGLIELIRMKSKNKIWTLTCPLPHAVQHADITNFIQIKFEIGLVVHCGSTLVPDLGEWWWLVG